MSTEHLLRSHDVAPARCDHKFIDSERCVKCGWIPLDERSMLATMFTLWARLTYEEQCEFLLRATTRSTEK